MFTVFIRDEHAHMNMTMYSCFCKTTFHNTVDISKNSFKYLVGKRPV